MRLTDDVPHIAGFCDLRKVGKGGFSVVYRAYQFEFSRHVAVKVSNRPLVDNTSLARFERECRSMGVLSKHPFIVTVFASSFTRDHRPCIVMDFFEHGNYQSKLRREGPLSVQELLSLGICMAGALETAHRHGVIHGDVKPENILLSEFGYPALGDFGIAAVRGRPIGDTVSLSVDYAAPELVEEGAEAVGPLSDQYSLGATLYTLATGRRPFQTTEQLSPQQTLVRVVSEPLPRLSDRFPEPLVTALGNSMARNPRQRYPDLATFAASLSHIERQLGYEPTRIPLGTIDRSISIRSRKPVTPHQVAPDSPTIIRPPSESLTNPDPRAEYRPRKRKLLATLIATLTIIAVAVTSFLLNQNNINPTSTTTITVQAISPATTSLTTTTTPTTTTPTTTTPTTTTPTTTTPTTTTPTTTTPTTTETATSIMVDKNGEFDSGFTVDEVNSPQNTRILDDTTRSQQISESTRLSANDIYNDDPFLGDNIDSDSWWDPPLHINTLGYGENGFRFTLATGNDDNVDNWARWDFDPLDGRYEVEAWIPSRWATAHVQYNIWVDKDGDSKFTVDEYVAGPWLDQQPVSGWASLGVYNLRGRVRIEIHDSRTRDDHRVDGIEYARIAADAVRLRKVPGS